MKQKFWWAYIPDVCEAGVVFPAATLEEAERIASDMLMGVEWSFDWNPREFYMYELGSLHHCNFTEEEDE
jgi:hypothetical protein